MKQNWAFSMVKWRSLQTSGTSSWS